MLGLVPGEDVLGELLALHAAPAAGGQAEVRGQQLRHDLHRRHLAVPVQGEPAAGGLNLNTDILRWKTIFGEVPISRP